MMPMMEYVVVFHVGFGDQDKFVEQITKWEKTADCFSMEITSIEELGK